MHRSITTAAGMAALLLAAMALVAASGTAEAQKGGSLAKCLSGTLDPGDGTQDLVIDRPCDVVAGTYRYENVNIVRNGILNFTDAAIEFRAESILIENEGKLIAGQPIEGKTIGSKPGGKLTIVLYGKDQGIPGKGVACVTLNCGIPSTSDNDVWGSNGARKYPMPGGGDDYFYQYKPLPHDEGNPKGYFGYKVLGVSYGGTLQLFGAKGATYGEIGEASSGTSWVRLNKTVKPADCTGATPCTLELNRPVDWVPGDKIVLTTTDYLPGHSEELTIAAVSVDRTQVTVTEKLLHVHNGERYDMSIIPDRLGLTVTDAEGATTKKIKAETRAAVALLTRSIRIVSGGSTVDEAFPAEPAYTPGTAGQPENYFGGHTVIRQGAKLVQIQGVEFAQLGQGGRLGHYPVHFHHARQLPTSTFVKDSSVNESMTRWFVLHGTHNVTLARNVGWKSIGHGYYLEEGTEIENRLLSNIGIFARAAIDNEQNPRKVPGILAAPTKNNMSRIEPNVYRTELVPFYSDYDHPTLFWIMNGWNDFQYNMAVGAGACGVCYWLLPGANSGHSRHQKWEGYASMQADTTVGQVAPQARAGLTPLKTFIGNSCSSASMSFNTVANTSACIGIAHESYFSPTNPDSPLVKAIPNPLAPPACDQSNPHQPEPNQDLLERWACADPSNKAASDYYPQVGGGGRFPTRCDTQNGDCSRVAPCAEGNLGGCMVTVIDDYTSSFHWPEQNFAAIWLRPQWYLFTNSVLSDVINAGLTFVTGGGYTSSDIVPGHWALAYKNVFIGETQPGNPLASIGSAVNPKGGLACDQPLSANHCLIAKEGVSLPKGNFGVNARLFNIYDGPAYQDSNAYLDIRTTTLDCAPGASAGGLSDCGSSKYLLGPNTGVPRHGSECFLPHAAIGWKQPNGFYYPPAFHSDNLFFHNVDIRHYVTQPLFKPGTFVTDTKLAWEQYCNFTESMFNNWTDIDRQTELNDDDGSLTGYAQTVSVNADAYFNAPKEAIECASAETAKTSPYDYVTTVVYPGCLLPGFTCPLVKPAFDANPDARISTWNKDCGGPFCYGVPMIRQLVTETEKAAPPPHLPEIRLAGQGTGQRSTLSVNNGTYYIDTTRSAEKQSAKVGPINQSSINVFMPGSTYYTFLLFAKPTTKQTYQIYVGKTDFNVDTDVWAVQANITRDPPVYTEVAYEAGQPEFPEGWTKTYANGILTVTMSMALDKFKLKWDQAKIDKCQPSSFCAPDGKVPAGCACATFNGVKVDAQCQDAVCSWAGNDAECPDGGCWGFAFKLPDSFDTDPAIDPRPDAQCLKVTDAGWSEPWKPASEALAGKKPVCFEAPVKTDNFCK